MSTTQKREQEFRIPVRALSLLKGEAFRLWCLIRSTPSGFTVAMSYLMRQMELSERQVRTLLATLAEKGMLETTSRRSTSGRLYNTYRAILPDAKASKKKN